MPCCFVSDRVDTMTWKAWRAAAAPEAGPQPPLCIVESGATGVEGSRVSAYQGCRRGQCHHFSQSAHGASGVRRHGILAQPGMPAERPPEPCERLCLQNGLREVSRSGFGGRPPHRSRHAPSQDCSSSPSNAHVIRLVPLHTCVRPAEVLVSSYQFCGRRGRRRDACGT